MSYIGSTPTTQSFIAGTDYFNGNGSTVNFTLSRSVNSVNDIEVIVNNVEQIPSGYSVSGTTLTFSAAPSAGTSNVYVRYLSTTLLSVAPTQGSSMQFGIGSAALPSISFTGDTNTGIFSPAADTIAFAEGGAEAMRIDSSGNVGIGTSSPTTPLDVKVGTGNFTVGLSGTANTQLTATGALRIDSTGGTLLLQTGGTERARIDSSGNVGIGTSSPAGNLHVYADGTNVDIQTSNNSNFSKIRFKGSGGAVGGQVSGLGGGAGLAFYYATTEAARIDSSGNWYMNSGYGSAAVAYGCRAWVNFNGTGTVAINGSGNVSSITDNGTGDYTVNFTTAMPDANYNVVLGSTSTTNSNNYPVQIRSTGAIGANTPSLKSTTQLALRVAQANGTAQGDSADINVSIFR